MKRGKEKTKGRGKLSNDTFDWEEHSLLPDSNSLKYMECNKNNLSGVLLWYE